ncbi:hypothetical protein VTK73DRAFT_6542 [Phialemonium thermophilum]|uniref:J domain-containing protein n=1 Tax=Phialemonium thermophilum TaxID=223376 RepID=A0ABR3XVC8_9PEZI
MAESVGRGSRGRRGRISSNASSARSSAILDDHLHPGLHSSQALRPVESRFSLNEQFAATRKDYEFGYDDASSVLDRASAADYKETDDTVVLDDLRDLTDGDEAPSRDCILSDRSFYELLCLPPTAAASPTEIRRAYYRLLQEIHPETQPQSLVPLAEALLNVVQTAFETLIEPHRKANYDMSLVALESEVDVFDEFRDAAISADGDRSYVDRLAEEYLNLTGGEIRTTTDLGLRLRPRSRLLGYARDSSYRRWATVDPVDFSLQQATTLNLAALNRGIQTLLDATTNCGTPGLPKGAIYCASTTATVTASIHGLMDGPFRLASLVFDRYQPPGPPLQGRRRLTQLLASRYLPLLNVKVRQEFVPDSEVTKQAKGRSTVVVEEEVDCLPVPAVTVRASRSFDLADGTEPLDVEISVTRILLRGSRISSMGLAAHKHVGDGTAFVAIDAGNWELWPAHESSRHPRFSKIVKRFSQAMTPFRSSPTVEVGYNVGSYPMGLRAGRAFTKPGNRGIRGMDIDMDDDRTGSWTASLGATTDTVAAYVRYGRDLFSSASASRA